MMMLITYLAAIFLLESNYINTIQFGSKLANSAIANRSFSVWILKAVYTVKEDMIASTFFL